MFVRLKVCKKSTSKFLFNATLSQEFLCCFFNKKIYYENFNFYISYFYHKRHFKNYPNKFCKKNVRLLKLLSSFNVKKYQLQPFLFNLTVAKLASSYFVKEKNFGLHKFLRLAFGFCKTPKQLIASQFTKSYI